MRIEMQGRARVVPISPMCVHWQGESECPAPDCYRRVPCAWADEAWALGKYSTPKLRASDSGFAHFGELINQLKYSVSTTQEYWADCLQSLAEQTARFVEGRLARSFEVCLVVPGNRPNTVSVMGEVAKHLITTGQVERIAQMERRSNIRILKQVAHEQRAEEVDGGYQLSGVRLSQPRAHILILDDVFDTGATLNEVAKTARRAAPSAYIAGVCATYLRDPKELVWKQ